MLAILKYRAGNQTSVRRALDSLGIANTITADPDELAAAQGVIFPGVGAAGTAMEELVGEGLDSVLKSLIWQEKPLLGICVGCQILLDYSEENDTKALSVIPGECRLFNPAWTEDEAGKEPIKVPHMGWNSVNLIQNCELFKGIDPRSEFYFVHSYYPAPAEQYVIGMTTYGRPFCSIHGRRGLWAVQFHPEKSGRPGLQLLANFAGFCREVSNAQ